MIHCPFCKEGFEPDVPEVYQSLAVLLFDCPTCNREFDIENIPKIVWRRADNGTYYTTLVSRFKTVNGFDLVRFDYYDYLKESM